MFHTTNQVQPPTSHSTKSYRLWTSTTTGGKGWHRGPPSSPYEGFQAIRGLCRRPSLQSSDETLPPSEMVHLYITCSIYTSKMDWKGSFRLVIDLPLWPSETYESVGMMTFPRYGKIIQMFQTTNQKWIEMVHLYLIMSCHSCTIGLYHRVSMCISIPSHPLQNRMVYVGCSSIAWGLIGHQQVHVSPSGEPCNQFLAKDSKLADDNHPAVFSIYSLVNFYSSRHWKWQ